MILQQDTQNPLPDISQTTFYIITYVLSSYPGGVLEAQIDVYVSLMCVFFCCQISWNKVFLVSFGLMHIILGQVCLFICIF